MIYFIFFLFLVYAAGIIYLTIKPRVFHQQSIDKISPGFSILIPLRNEENRIQKLFDELVSQDHSAAYEIIFIDDHSTDSTSTLLQQLIVPPQSSAKIQFLTLANNEFGKKAALKKAFSIAKGEWIISVDADTYHDSKWLNTISTHCHDMDLLILPVLIKPNKGFLNFLEQTEFEYLQALAEASQNLDYPVLANGANLAIRSDAYKLFINPTKFEKYASGDDTLLLDDFYLAKAKIKYVYDSNAIIYTDSCNHWYFYVHQRLRWNSKNKAYQSLHFYVVGVWFLLGNLAVFSSLIWSLFSFQGLIMLILILAFKSIFELIFIKRWKKSMRMGETARIINKQSDWKRIGVLLIYPFIFLVLLILNYIISPQWKGRTIN